MDISRKLAVEFPDGTIRQFATITEAAQRIGVSVAAVSKAIASGKDRIKDCIIRGLNNRLFIVKRSQNDPYVVCRMTAFGMLKEISSTETNEKIGINPYDCFVCREIVETKAFAMTINQRIAVYYKKDSKE